MQSVASVSRYFTSDLHFFDQGIMSYCGRPFSSADEMNETLIKNFKRKVNGEGEIYLLGDILGGRGAQARDCAEVLEQMGIKDPKTPFHLILGNHDHFPEQSYLDMGFISVKKIDIIDLGGNKIMLTHDPCMIQQKNTLALCGHIHTLFDRNYNPERNTLTINVSVERRDYAPVSEEEILEIIKDENWSAK